MLGQAVVAAARDAGHDVVALDRAALDITDADACERALAGADAIVNCAAWTDVDGAEEHEQRATAVNGAGAGNLAAAATAAGARLVHVSTDYVFDGALRGRPYTESDPVAPLNAYGRSKLAGERAVVAAGEQHAIVRTAWVFGPGGRNFVDTMLGLARERESVRVVTDQTGSPTWTCHLAPALLQIAQDGPGGIAHVAGGGACTWNDLARAAFAAAGLGCQVEPATSDEFSRPAARPAWSVLASERDDVPHLPPWEEGVAAHVRATMGT